MTEDQYFKSGLEQFRAHYASRFQQVAAEGGSNSFQVKAGVLKEGNHPRIFHHNRRTADVLVLTHGLSDSPYYVEAIARRFFNKGCNVILPLLPGHGLRDPDKAMEDYDLDSKWKATLDNAVTVAQTMGGRISLGGFSTGGALSLNKVLRDPGLIGGGLFLFSAALDLGSLVEGAGQSNFLQAITKFIDGKVQGIGRDPYKYPAVPIFAGSELTQIINENNELMEGKKIQQQVFAAHSLHDTTVRMEGMLDFLGKNVHKGMAFIISEKVSHSELVLEKDIILDTTLTAGPKYPPRANPKFDWMMDDALRFFEEEVRN